MESVIDLRSSVSESEQFARDRALAVNKSIYEWSHLPGLPAFCKGLPAPEEVSKFQKERFDYDIGVSIASGVVSAVGWLRDKNKENKLSHYDDFYRLMRKPTVSARWRHDEEFARQRLNGVNPLLIKRVVEIPENFPVTDEVARRVLPDGASLEVLLAAGRILLCDWAPLAGVPVTLGRFLTAPMALFWVDDRGVLMPLAIQLGQSPAEASVIFTPADDRWLWLAARTHVQAADAAYHETVVHLLRTHLIMETVWVATCRSLPPQHPIHELLAPHFAGTININYKARNELIVPGGPIAEAIAVGTDGAYWLINKALADFSFSDLDPVQDMATRGTDDVETLPGYHYRDDAKLLWSAISDYTEELLGIFYPTDESVAVDAELADWAQELTDLERGGLRGLPLVNGHLTTVADLHHVIRQTIFTASAEHSAVNNGQYDIFGYIPNAPGAVYLPPPRTHAASSEGEFTYMLPPMKSVAVQMALVHLLSMPSLSQLGRYPRDFFQEDASVRQVVDRFRHRLDQIAFFVEERNATIEVPYTYLDPVQVAGSINV